MQQQHEKHKGINDSQQDNNTHMEDQDEQVKIVAKTLFDSGDGDDHLDVEQQVGGMGDYKEKENESEGHNDVGQDGQKLVQYEDQPQTTAPQPPCHPPPQQQYQPLQSYTISRTLGKGNFGKVKLAKHKLTQEFVAVKILEKDLIFQNTDIVRITRELKIMKKLRHPFVVQLYEIIETPKQLYLIMEYAEGGDLFDKIVTEERIKEAEAALIFGQIVLGMEYFHAKGVTHRDLKPENILLGKDGSIKIADFGLGNMFKPQEKLKTACGSPCYASPEMLNRQAYDPKKIDIWSSGIILYAMVCGYLPFQDQVTSKLYQKIKTMNIKLPSWVSSPCRNLIRGLLTKDPKLRLDIDSILSHEFLSPHILKLQQVIREKELTQDKIEEICEMYGIEERGKLVGDLGKNRHNNLTTLYFLAVRRLGREEEREEEEDGEEEFLRRENQRVKEGRYQQQQQAQQKKRKENNSEGRKQPQQQHVTPSMEIPKTAQIQHNDPASIHHDGSQTTRENTQHPQPPTNPPHQQPNEKPYLASEQQEGDKMQAQEGQLQEKGQSLTQMQQEGQQRQRQPGHQIQQGLQQQKELQGSSDDGERCLSEGELEVHRLQQREGGRSDDDEKSEKGERAMENQHQPPETQSHSHQRLEEQPLFVEHQYRDEDDGDEGRYKEEIEAEYQQEKGLGQQQQKVIIDHGKQGEARGQEQEGDKMDQEGQEVREEQQQGLQPQQQKQQHQHDKQQQQQNHQQQQQPHSQQQHQSPQLNQPSTPPPQQHLQVSPPSNHFTPLSQPPIPPPQPNTIIHDSYQLSMQIQRTLAELKGLSQMNSRKEESQNEGREDGDEGTGGLMMQDQVKRQQEEMIMEEGDDKQEEEKGDKQEEKGDDKQEEKGDKEEEVKDVQETMYGAVDQVGKKSHRKEQIDQQQQHQYLDYHKEQQSKPQQQQQPTLSSTQPQPTLILQDNPNTPHPPIDVVGTSPSVNPTQQQKLTEAQLLPLNNNQQHLSQFGEHEQQSLELAVVPREEYQHEQEQQQQRQMIPDSKVEVHCSNQEKQHQKQQQQVGENGQKHSFQQKQKQQLLHVELPQHEKSAQNSDHQEQQEQQQDHQPTPIQQQTIAPFGHPLSQRSIHPSKVEEKPVQSVSTVSENKTTTKKKEKESKIGGQQGNRVNRTKKEEFANPTKKEPKINNDTNPKSPIKPQQPYPNPKLSRQPPNRHLLFSNPKSPLFGPPSPTKPQPQAIKPLHQAQNSSTTNNQHPNQLINMNRNTIRLNERSHSKDAPIVFRSNGIGGRGKGEKKEKEKGEKKEEESPRKVGGNCENVRKRGGDGKEEYKQEIQRQIKGQGQVKEYRQKKSTNVKQKVTIAKKPLPNPISINNSTNPPTPTSTTTPAQKFQISKTPTPPHPSPNPPTSLTHLPETINQQTPNPRTISKVSNKTSEKIDSNSKNRSRGWVVVDDNKGRGGNDVGERTFGSGRKGKKFGERFGGRKEVVGYRGQQDEGQQYEQRSYQQQHRHLYNDNPNNKPNPSPSHHYQPSPPTQPPISPVSGRHPDPPTSQQTQKTSTNPNTNKPPTKVKIGQYSSSSGYGNVYGRERAVSGSGGNYGSAGYYGQGNGGHRGSINSYNNNKKEMFNNTISSFGYGNQHQQHVQNQQRTNLQPTNNPNNTKSKNTSFQHITLPTASITTSNIKTPFTITRTHQQPQLINPQLIAFVSISELEEILEGLGRSGDSNGKGVRIEGSLSVYEYPTKDYVYVQRCELARVQLAVNSINSPHNISHKHSYPVTVNKSFGQSLSSALYSPSSRGKSFSQTKQTRSKLETFQFVQLVNSIVLESGE